MRDKYLEEDLDYIAESTLPFDELFHKTVFVTGATGLVGSMVVKALLHMNAKKAADITVLAFVRNMEKTAALYREFDTTGLVFVIGDLDCPIHDDTVRLSNGKRLSEVSVDYVVHGASPTSSKYFVTYPVETIMTSVLGTRHVLELAREKACKGVVYMSSMEAYGAPDPTLPCVREENLGYIDVLNPRSCYSEGKRMCECLCASYSSEYQLPIRIARLAQTFGAGVPYGETRVFAQFAKSAMNKTDIVLHTEGKSVGNYCYTRDSVMGILLLLLRGENGQAYTVSNPESNIQIRDMAKLVCERIANSEISVVFDIPESAMTFGYAPDVNMRLNSDKLKALGWEPVIGLEEAYRRMISSMELTKEA